MQKYFMGEIDLPNGRTGKRLIQAYNLAEAHKQIEKYIAKKQDDYDHGYGFFGRPIGSFIARYATTQEILKDVFIDIQGEWEEINIDGLSEEIIEIVIESIPRQVFKEELERRAEEGDTN